MKKGVTDRFQSCGEIESTHEFEVVVVSIYKFEEVCYGKTKT